MNKRFIKLLALIVLVSISLIMSLSSSVQASDGNYQSINGKKIMLDPGHGGNDPGAVKNGYYEKNLNSQLTEKVAGKLRLMGANIVFIREPEKDISVELVDRPVIANDSKADLFISIHHNSSVSSTPKGVSTHYSSFKPGVETNDVYVEYNNVKYKFISEAEVNGTRGFYINYNGVKKFVSVNDATAFDPTPSEEAKRGRALAEKIVDAVAGLGLENDGSSDHNLYVTKTTNMPSLLIEAGYISNSTEVKKLADPAFQDKIAEKVAVSVAEYFEEYYPQPEVVIGWFKDASGNWYYIKDASGNRMSGWMSWNNKWYYFDSSGIMKTGWVLTGGKWYYLDEQGAMKTGWLKLSNKWYYLDGSGARKIGWIMWNGNWYLLDGSGVMRTGWIPTGGKWYYLYEDGAMAHDTIIDNKYTVGSDGAWIQ